MTDLPNYSQANEDDCIIIAMADVRFAQTGKIMPEAEVQSLYRAGWFWSRIAGGSTGIRMWELFLRGEIGSFGRIRGTKDIRKAIDNHQGCMVGIGGVHQVPALRYSPETVTVRNLYTNTGNAESVLSWDDLRRFMKNDASAFQFAPPREWNWRIVGHGMAVNWWLWTLWAALAGAIAGYAILRLHG